MSKRWPSLWRSLHTSHTFAQTPHQWNCVHITAKIQRFIQEGQTPCSERFAGRRRMCHPSIMHYASASNIHPEVQPLQPAPCSPGGLLHAIQCFAVLPAIVTKPSTHPYCCTAPISLAHILPSPGCTSEPTSAAPHHLMPVKHTCAARHTTRSRAACKARPYTDYSLAACCSNLPPAQSTSAPLLLAKQATCRERERWAPSAACKSRVRATCRTETGRRLQIPATAHR